MKRSPAILKFLVMLGMLAFGLVANVSAQGLTITRQRPPVRTMPPAPLIPSPGSGCVAPPPGLVGWWKRDGNTIDSVSGNNGVAQNVTYTSGVAGQAFAFDPENFPYGTYTAIQIADQPAYALTNALSIEGWIRPRGDGYCIFWRGDNRPGPDPYMLSMQGDNESVFTLKMSPTILILLEPTSITTCGRMWPPPGMGRRAS